MKKLVKYTVYFEYEDDFWDTAGDEVDDGDGHMRYFIEEHNCHANFIHDLEKSMEENGDDICQSGETKVIDPSEVPQDIEPYIIKRSSVEVLEEMK